MLAEGGKKHFLVRRDPYDFRKALRGYEVPKRGQIRLLDKPLLDTFFNRRYDSARY
jgi:hypothetical protein